MLYTSFLILFIGITTAILDIYFPWNQPKIESDYIKRVNDVITVQSIRLTLIFLLAVLCFFYKVKK